ncbi:MAG TPA: DUF2752 domain-containing protein [Kofleriaceae bacterium]|nr:DUF2752 domain-containing protein [Kofleriaceae bacterium]
MSLRGRTLDVALGGLAAAQLGIAAWLRPDGNSVSLADGRPLGGMCLVHNLFGVDCPFCGMTRSFVALAHGEVGKAFEFHPAGPLLFLAMIVFVLSVGYVTVQRVTPLVERKRFLFTFQSIALVCLAIGVFKLVRS